MPPTHAQPLRQPPVLQTTHYHALDASPTAFPLPNEINSSDRPVPPGSTLHSRDASIARGRTYAVPPQTVGNAQTQSRAQSAQPQVSDPGFGRGSGDSLHRRPSNSYGHHRQTSVIHGIQHSRNTSFNSPTSGTPLSPDSIASAISPSGELHTTGNGRAFTPNMLSQFDSPVSTTGPHSHGLSIDSFSGSTLTSDEVGGGLGHVRKLTSSARPKRLHAHHGSYARHHPEARTPGEYALHHLLNSFVVQADNKINQCIQNVDELVTPVEQICGPGADPRFDQLISALGHIASPAPKPLIDSLMFWRKAKGEAHIHAKNRLQPLRPMPGMTALPITLPRRNTEPTQTNGAGNGQLGDGDSHPTTQPDDEVLLTERRATVSVYLVCRVLIEVFEQSSLAAITPELADKLEDIVFGQIHGVDPAQMSRSSLRLANWRIYGELLGHMSGVNFSSVTARFLRELDAFQQKIAINTGNLIARDAEARAELLIHGMRHLRIKTAPGLWEKSCDFFRDLGRLFSHAHGQRIKQAYCQVLEKLLIFVAGDVHTDLTPPKWKEFLDLMSTRLTPMLTKWLPTISSLAPKLKDRTTRFPCLQAICRLTWTYSYRDFEAPAVAIRKIEEVIRIAFPQGKRAYMSNDPATAELLIQLIRIVGFKHQDLCFRNIIFPMISSDLFQSGKELRIEHMEPEKMVIGIRSFLAVMSDLENGMQGLPKFPSSFYAGASSEPTSMNAVSGKSEPQSDVKLADGSRSDPSSRPVDIARLNDITKQYYLRFCEILGKITILCDNTFGGQAALNEKFSSGAVPPKTPLVEAFTFSRKEEASTGPDQKQLYYDLLHVAIQALPRCFSDRIPLNPLINLLCTGSAHIQQNIATSSAQSLRSIARQGHAQAVAIAFPRFIFSYDSKYSTMSDEGMLGPGHIETTLTLYIELLQIWTEELTTKSQNGGPEAPTPSTARGVQLEMTQIFPHVDEIEAYGLFFLCSQSRRVRAFAVKVLRLVTDFDKALGRDEPSRIIKILESESSKILTLDDENLTLAERSRLLKGKGRNATQNTLIEICSSEVSYDSSLWAKVFPNLVRVTFEMCPNAIALSRGIVCDRLLLIQASMDNLSKLPRLPRVAAHDFQGTGRSAATHPEVLIQQWKLYLIMACGTLSSAGAQSQSQLASAAHIRKTSKNSSSSKDLSSARSLFAAIIPLLQAGPDTIRDAAVVALGSINRKLYRTLLESLQYAVTTCNDEAKARIGTHQRNPSSPHRNSVTERLRTEVTHVYKLTSSFLIHPDVYNDDWILGNLVNYTKDLRIFLSDAQIQNDWEFQRLRLHYCGLMQEVFEGINRSKQPFRWMPFEARKSAFTLMEEWYGFSEHGRNTSRDDPMRHNLSVPHAETGERMNVNAAMEIEKQNLRVAASSAMASLCAGPISITTQSDTTLFFQLSRMLKWIDSIFATVSDKMRAIGRRALKLLIEHNPEWPQIMDHAIERCYRTDRPKVLEGYFDVVSQILIQQKDYPLPFWRILAAVIFTLGNDSREIRMKSAHLLRTLDERQQKSSKLQDFDISISDKTRTVYKLAQFEYSKRLSKAHSDIAFTIFSEFSLHFKDVVTDHQRNMVAAILPWVQTMELQVDASGNPTPKSYMLLSNMFEITIRTSHTLHNEVQALWQALSTGPHAGNVQVILDFITSLSLERREQNFVDHAKQIVVYLSATLAGSRVVDFLLLQLVPKSMVNEKKSKTQPSPDMSGFPYVADLAIALPTGNKQSGLSLGQVALIFLVDLMVAPMTLPRESAIKLIHAVLILWDHYTPSVQEQAREMLVHLIHELVTAKVGDDVLSPRKPQIERLVESIRRSESHVVWAYEDNTGKDDDDGASRVPPAMTFLTKEVVDLFSLTYEKFSELWAKKALQWASTCPVRHLACRSFQAFRCISVTIDARMLADMLARLSNTIADEQTDYQTFSMEILTTLKVIIGALDPQDLLRYPQLFWTTAACLNTIHEREFSEALGMLEKLASKLNLSDVNVITTMLKAKPPKWEGEFDGLQPLVYKGLKSADSLDRTLLVLHKLADLPSGALVGDDDRLLYNTLANLPHFLHQFDLPAHASSASECALRLADVAEKQGCPALVECLLFFARGRYRTSGEFLAESTRAIRLSFFPRLGPRSLIFLFGFLTNQTPWFRLKTMEILCVVIPLIDMKSAEIACHGPDLISPLLRLLQTDHCQQALEVMDNIMTVSENPMEREHIRMSMVSGPATAIRKEYERTQSLYGIPHSSGWSIPMPAVFSSLTRNNVHAVFYTCGDTEILEQQADATPDVEFPADEGYGDSYFPSSQQTDTMNPVDTVTDANMGDLVNQLDSLDDFFDEPEVMNTPTGNRQMYMSNYIPPDMHENGASIYDQHTAPILRKSLARTPSSSSFQNGLAEARPPTSHYNHNLDLNTTPSTYGNPSATATPIEDLGGPGPSLPNSTKKSTLPPVSTLSSSRPGLHARSITSPANQYPVSKPTAAPFVVPVNGSSFSSEGETSEYSDEAAFSDSESSPFPALSLTVSNPTTHSASYGGGGGSGSSGGGGGGGGLHPRGTPTSATPVDSATSNGNGPFSFEGVRRGMRRLTGSKGDMQKERERVRDMARLRALSSSGGGQAQLGPPISPKVPRVPVEYLTNGGGGGGGSSSAGGVGVGAASASAAGAGAAAGGGGV